MERRMHSRRMVRVPVEVSWGVLVAVGLVSSGMAVGLPRHAPGHSDAVYWATAAAAAALFTGCLLVHGLAQGVAARRRGMRVEVLHLRPFGGLVRAEGPPVTPATELHIAVAGLVSLGVLAGGFQGLAFVLATTGGPHIGVWAGGWLARLTAILAVVQLLPVFPLDGGRILRAVLWRRYGNRSAAAMGTAISGRLTSGILTASGAVALLAGAFAEGLWTLLTGWILLGGDQAPVTVADVMTQDTVVAPGWLTVEAFLEDYHHLPSFSALPVQRFSGEIDGLLSWDRLAEVPEAARSSTRVSDIAHPLDDVVTAVPKQALSDLVDRLSGPPEHPVLVLDRGRLVGIVARSDASVGQ
jgi:Zn-dependent protease